MESVEITTDLNYGEPHVQDPPSKRFACRVKFIDRSRRRRSTGNQVQKFDQVRVSWGIGSVRLKVASPDFR